MTSQTTIPATSGAFTGGIQMPKTVKVQALNHFFGEGELRKQALYENNLEVRRGEIVIMTGPSGSGKTTLLTLIGTLRTVQEGSLKVLGNELCGADRDLIVRIRKEMGFIFQAHNLFESLTAYQNVNMAAELVGLDPMIAEGRINSLLTRLGLGHRIHYKPKSLSGGQKQRVAIARGLVHKPKLILADEPTAALDEKSGREVVTLFQELARDEGCTIIMVTHDNRILDVADRIVNMVDGKIKSDVAVQETSVICEFLKEFPLFADLTPNTLAEVADQMMVHEAQSGEAIIRQGDAGDLFYLIRTGSVDVLINDGTGDQKVAELNQGQYFGEAALITDEPRNATIVAREPSVFYALGKDEFRAVLETSATFEEELRQALFRRQ
ncbi:ATP-binding cassette domain-containing protein [Bythopirellula polymerisocia]|uniref:Macrolide export ATP-binding/permease protein MacB n=1 Tax=Bythopirellula polymerisocia TaxID=2528003 RepID=A0A5C6CAP1_9BACT|nr:ATP-binding cassette domain-containing protein [Bythopirellula polymerisocia]TWU21288.1 Macrolide export ATP-binding/permease protein MacB [Bythopirellula polymerisocia]